MASLYMGTTKIAATRTAGQVTEFLAAAGAEQVMQTFDPSRPGQVLGLTFSLRINENQVAFHLPVNIDPVFELLNRQRPVKTRQKHADADMEQACRTAWRQILRWVEAQFALIHTGMVKTEEVFLPYATVDGTQTLYSRFANSGFQKLLPGRKRDEL